MCPEIPGLPKRGGYANAESRVYVPVPNITRLFPQPPWQNNIRVQEHWRHISLRPYIDLLVWEPEIAELKRKNMCGNFGSRKSENWGGGR
jgi:hypothetical protein